MKFLEREKSETERIKFLKRRNLPKAESNPES